MKIGRVNGSRRHTITDWHVNFLFQFFSCDLGNPNWRWDSSSVDLLGSHPTDIWSQIAVISQCTFVIQNSHHQYVNWGCHFVALLNGNACTWFSKPSFPHQSSHRRHHSLTPLYQLLLEGEEGSNSLEGQILVSIIINPWLNKVGTCSNQLGIIKAWWLSSNDLFGSWENRLIWSELENL